MVDTDLIGDVEEWWMLKLRLRAEDILGILEEYQASVRKYNALIRDSGFYLKPIHIVVKKVKDERREYRYFGKYWWRIEYLGRKDGKPVIKWIYLGREKPSGLPDPPVNPLEGFCFYTIQGEKDYIYVSNRVFLRYRRKLEDLLGKKISVS